MLQRALTALYFMKKSHFSCHEKNVKLIFFLPNLEDKKASISCCCSNYKSTFVAKIVSNILDKCANDSFYTKYFKMIRKQMWLD